MFKKLKDKPGEEFVFPKTPQTQVTQTSTSDSESQSDWSGPRRRRSRVKRSPPVSIVRSPHGCSWSPALAHGFMPPIGVFWDIENCHVPKGCSAVLVAQVIRDTFFDGYREAEFLVVCDVTKEHSRVIEELNDAQVNLIHVPSLHKNAADEKLRQSMRRFADLHGPPAAVVLITGDINFIADVCDLRHRRKLHVILLHRENTSEALIRSANENHNIVEMFKSLPPRTEQTGAEAHQLMVYELPAAEPARLRNRLKRISENCGGRVLQVFGDGSASLGFTSHHLAARAAKRMEGADVFGSKITVGVPQRMDQQRHASTPFTGNNTRWKSPDLMPPPTFQPLANQARSAKSAGPIAAKPIPTISGRRLTPSPYKPLSDSWEEPRRTTPNSLPDIHERYFHPISAGQNEPVELQITNVDQSIDRKQMKQVLTDVFSEHVTVLAVNCFTQADGQTAAHVRVASLAEAQYAISRLHRRRVGRRRIFIAYSAAPAGPQAQLVRAQVVALLQEVPGHRLALFKFCEMFERRYLSSVSVSDLYRMRDCCIIEEGDRRSISLSPEHRNTPSPVAQELSYCSLHGSADAQGWAERSASVLPSVRMSLKLLTSRVHALIQSHNGTLPLPSVGACYAAQFSTLEEDESGVPLEHLLSCLPGVEIAPLNGVKVLRWAQQPDNDQPGKCVSPPLAAQQSLLARELVDLLKTQPRCQLPFNRFIPAYHHQFGRQCRVADYGFVKLADLLDALSHIVQVMGEGGRRVLTLSHRAQVRRFTSDLLRLLKAQPSKQVALTEFADLFRQHIGREWDVVDYGVCDLADLLSEVSRTTVSVSKLEDDVIVSIPRHVQTPDEQAKMQQFAKEVVELLSHAPQCRLPFNKFIPAYHHHFGRQCRLADYGHTKLIELFDAIAHIVTVEDSGERVVALTAAAGRPVLERQVCSLLAAAPDKALALSEVQAAFTRRHGYALKPQQYGCDDLAQLMASLDNVTVASVGYRGPMVCLLSPDAKVSFQNDLWLYDPAPKPDSPPKMGWNAAVWLQNTPELYYQLPFLSNYMDLCIELPPCEILGDLSQMNLMSPTKSLLAPGQDPMAPGQDPMAPDASQLPMPTALHPTLQAPESCDLNTGTSTGKGFTPGRGAPRKPRLAAHFSSLIGT